MLVGLQGGGKTTIAAKLGPAPLGQRPLLVAAVPTVRLP
jgi:signal recognition particle GTPase